MDDAKDKILNSQLDELEKHVKFSLETGEGESALKVCLEVYRQMPGNFRVIKLIAQVYLETGRIEKACKTYLGLTRDVPDDPDVYKGLARSLSSSKRNKISSKLDAYADRIRQANGKASNPIALSDYRSHHLIWSEDFRCTAEGEINGLRPPLLLATEVWGEKYLNILMKFHIPSLLLDGNLPLVVSERPRSSYHISLPVADYLRLKAEPIFGRLCSVIDVRLDVIKHPTPEHDKYSALIPHQEAKLRRASRDGFYYCSISPDGFIGNGSLKSAITQLEEANKKAFMVFAPRLSLEQFSYYTRECDGEGFASLFSNRRKLVELVLASIHPGDRSLDVTSIAHSEWTWAVTWKIQGQGLLARVFHLHPVIMHPALLKCFDGIAITLDNELVPKLAGGLEDLLISTDSDDFLYASLAEENDNGVIFPERRWFHRDRVMAWLNRFGSPYNLAVFGESIKFHNTELDPELWFDAESAAVDLERWLNSANDFDHTWTAHKAADASNQAIKD